MKTVIYFHICCANNWTQIFNMLMSNIKMSGLYDAIDEIRCVVLGEAVIRDPKIKVIYQTLDLSVYEFKIMELMYQDALHEDFRVLYIHTKGIKHYGSKNVADWVKLLVYYNIVNYEFCLLMLNQYDAVGVNLQNNPVWHFSGNFWWSTSRHIRTLGQIADFSYNGPEFYICLNTNASYVSLWNSDVNHYESPYSMDNYVGKIALINNVQ